jgi:hypothetical protein
LANNLDLLAVPEVRCDNRDSKPTDDYTFFYANWNASLHLETSFFICKGIISAVKTEFISDGMSCITLLGHCHDIVLNVHAPNVDKNDDTVDSFCMN